MKLPIKWIIFRAANYLHAAGALGMLCLFAYEFDNFYFGSSVDVFLFLLFVAGFLCIIANAGINLVLLERYYPAAMPGQKLWRWGGTLYVGTLVFVIILFFLLIRFYWGTSLKINYGYQMVDLLTVIFASLIIASAIPVFWLQVLLRKTIKRNYDREMENFLTTQP